MSDQPSELPQDEVTEQQEERHLTRGEQHIIHRALRRSLRIIEPAQHTRDATDDTD